MTPLEIYALPNKSTDQWFEAHPEMWQEIFGMYPDVLTFDEIESVPADAKDRLMVELKLDCSLDGGRRFASLTVISFDGAPFAIVGVAGREGRDFGETLITDEVLFEDAFKYFVSKALTARPNKPKHVDASMSVPMLHGFHGAAIVKTVDGVEMVRSEYVDKNGVLLFDVKKYDAAFDSRRGTLSKFPKGQSLLANEATARQIVAEIIESGIVDSAKHVIVNRRSKKDDMKGDWIAVAAANDSGTYAIGIRKWDLGGTGFSWVSSIFCERIGGPGLFEELKAGLPSPIVGGAKP